MKICSQVGALDAGAIPTVYKEDVVNNSAFSRVLHAASLVLSNCSGKLSARRLLLVGDEQTVLAHLADPFLHRRKHLLNSMHPMKVKVAMSSWMRPIHSHEDHVRGRSHERLETATIEAHSKVDQIGKGLETLLAMEESVPVHLYVRYSHMLRRENVRYLLNVAR